MVSDALVAPTAVGANVTFTVQDEPAGSAPTQLFVWLYWVAFVPPMPMLLIVIDAVPLFVTVTVWAVLTVPTS